MPAPSATIRRFRVDPKWAGLIAFVWVSLNLGSIGITIDEPLDVAPGRHYWTTLFELGPRAFSAEGVQSLFGGNPDHPPLARWILGAFSKTFETAQILIVGTADSTGLYVIAARLASAAAFGLTVALLGQYVGCRSGQIPGWVSALSYMTLPHVFGHAHLAALETVLNLTWLVACLAWIRWFESPKVVHALVAGVYTGLACLTKIQGWVMFPWILVLLSFSGHSLNRKLTGLAGISIAPVVWLLGWPWVWYESVGRLRAYFASSVDRIHLKVLYFGQIYQDDELPWHFAIVQWIASIPPIVLILFLVGTVTAWSSREKSADRFWSLIPVGILVLFSMPIARYDSDRLYLVQWPAVAILAGSGMKRISDWPMLAHLPSGVLRLIFAGFLSWSIYECRKPSPLSYVSPLAGGIVAFESAGMDLNYWGDAVDSKLMADFLERYSDGETVAVVPTLANGQSAFLTPASLMKKGVLFQDQSRWREADWIVVYRRPSYWPEGFAEWIETHKATLTRERDGVWISGIWAGPRKRYER